MIQSPPDILSEAVRARWSLVQSSIWRPDPVLAPDEISVEIARGLFDQPRRLDARFLYDERGSRLFEGICALPEYYLTRTEEEILSIAAQQIVETTGVEHVVELGSGFSRKTLHLLEEQVQQRGGGTYAPVDVSLTALLGSKHSVTGKFPEIEFTGLCASYEEAIASIDARLPTLFVFLGSSVGNFDHVAFSRFFKLLERCMGPRDFLLLGVDRIKPREILEKAYDDSHGLTAEFILNGFNNVNDLLESNFDTRKIRYSSRYEPVWQRVEMFGVSMCDQEIALPALGETFLWREEERILVEISRKFDPHRLSRELRFFGLESLAHFTDPKEWFSLLLFKKGAESP